ncbi:MAG: hypothetical protein JSV14_06190 [Deltaproteobacteria bacterium]|nr:MAG: hypothetical protein JSV14_06190 [Deltaproteobacteria bacterium]
MSKVIRISQSIFQRLQKLAIPLEDTSADVIERLLDFYDAHRGCETPAIAADKVQERKQTKDPSSRAPRERGVSVKVESQFFGAHSLADLYLQVLRFLCDHAHIQKIESHLPLSTSRKRYLIATNPVHPSGRGFFAPIEYDGYFMETHKSYETGIKHLRKMLDICGLSLDYLG